jgi:hypothetical protein
MRAEVVGRLINRGATTMKDEYVWNEDPRIMVPLVLAILFPGIVKIVLSIIGLF